MKAKAIAVLGTGSDVGKSLIACALCRLFSRTGIRVAPFKGQNMSLNSYVTPDGGEMGRAQVLQAQACRLPPHVDMNPILLKPEADATCQVIVHGNVWRSQQARDYFKGQSDLFEAVKSSYGRLAGHYEAVVIEGAGSAAEMNLRDRDIVNWPVVELADAAVVLVADIDRGGVFAQVIGTMDLLSPQERGRVIGVIVNKFRGDRALFQDGVAILEARTGVPVLGVVPYLRHLELDQEDSVEVERYRQTVFEDRAVNIAVVLLPHMSNFTDFNQLAAEPDVALRYVAQAKDCQGADVIILPGSKTTIADLEDLRGRGFHRAIANHRRRGRELVGICGGFQMLGHSVTDPHGMEAGSRADGFGLLPMTTELRREKKTVQVTARSLFVGQEEDCLVEGYEIHLGTPTFLEEVTPCFHLIPDMKDGSGQDGVSGLPRNDVDGARSEDELVWGTYIHGVFDRPQFRRAWLNRVRARKGLPPLEIEVSLGVSSRLEEALDRWADHVAAHLNLEPILSVIGRRDG